MAGAAAARARSVARVDDVVEGNVEEQRLWCGIGVGRSASLARSIFAIQDFSYQDALCMEVDISSGRVAALGQESVAILLRHGCVRGFSRRGDVADGGWCLRRLGGRGDDLRLFGNVGLDLEYSRNECII